MYNLRHTPSLAKNAIKSYVNLSTSSADWQKNNNLLRQVKILSKFVGTRVAGSKKKWYPIGSTNTRGESDLVNNGSGGLMQINFSKSNKDGKNTKRRITVLNKLFMTHITDLLATGQASEDILGKGLQISRVKVTPDFTGVNVYWASSDEDNSKFLEEGLHKCVGYIRHELSQLRVMGEVPRIYFLKDKTFANISEVENLLKVADYGPTLDQKSEHQELDRIRRELNFQNTENILKQEDVLPPEMRHDILGLDHKEIMLKIHTKLKKSKIAWEMHEQQGLSLPVNLRTESAKPTLPQSEGFNKFILKRQQQHMTSKKKWRDDTDYSRVLSPNNGKLDEFYDQDAGDGDFLEDFEENSKNK